MVRKQGTVKFFDIDRGFGFIQVNGVDYFVHVTNVRGEHPLIDGEEVEFKPVKGKKDDEYEALDVKRLDPPEMTYEEGIVERYNDEKGYGFVTRGASRGDVFVHVNNLKDPHDELYEGAEIGYRVCAGEEGRTRAYEVEILEE